MDISTCRGYVEWRRKEDDQVVRVDVDEEDGVRGRVTAIAIACNNKS